MKPSCLVIAALWAAAFVSAPIAHAGAAGAADPGWPRTHTTAAGARVQVYEPQIASWNDQRHLVAYVAVAHSRRAGDPPVLGTLKVEADTTVALEERVVRFTAFTVAEASFAGLDRQRLRQILVDVEAALPAFERVIALDRVLAGLDASRIQPRNVEGVKADPPRVFFSATPAVLVSFDGTPIWSPIAGADLRYAVNTNWDVFEHGATGALYLRHGDVWLTARALDGPWGPAATLPSGFARLPADANWKDVRASLPGRRVKANQLPTVFVSTTPAELILLRGAPSYLQVAAGSDLLWVQNTASDVFRLGTTGRVYYLVAGRWFAAPDFAGPWTFATPTLPADFRRIPADHPRARVLASVAGTPQAAEAVVLAQIPQTATVNRKALTAPEVVYAGGTAQFELIERTTVARAVNTDKDVVRAGELYYLCFQGVWFVSTRPSGPWQVAASVPPAVYTIPASSPSHHVTYVTVVETTPEAVVFAAAAGYTGVTIAWGCAVWGTGWYYAPYVWYGGAYPVYYPYYPTYGSSAWYNPWSGAYQRGAVAYGPYGGVGAAARYNPATGTYARGAMAWGPYGATGAAQAYNPRTGTYAQTRQEAGVYGNWGSSYVQRGDDWARTGHVTNDVTGVSRAGIRTDDGVAAGRSGPNGNGFVAAGEDGVYAGRDGNVYRRADGGWQKYEDGAWGATQTPARDGAATARERAGSAGVAGDGSTLGQLEKDRAARLDGGQRARDRAATSRPSGSRLGSGSRPSGGPRGGGGRRR